ncbi:MAG: hypothetical protein HY851_06735 [candidate division Zixibacteria bacterium]|nr:hypothetical protein [candidate division Zixibacteria bacterium]
MRVSKQIRLAGLGLVLEILAGCAGTTAPRGWLPTAAESQTLAYGAWARVEILDTNLVFEGELIAAVHDTLFVLGDTIAGLPRKSLYRVTLTRYQQQHGSLAAWTLAGTLSTISHGWVLVLSAPTWIASGIGASAGVSREPLVRPRLPKSGSMPRETLENLSQYARFPQGFPESIDRSTIKPR